MTPPPPPSATRRSALLRLAVLVAGLGVVALAARRSGLAPLAEPQALLRAVDAVRGEAWAAPAFVVVYAVIAGLGLPGTPLTLAGGALFGAVAGTALNWVGATAGATLAFLLARGLGRDALRALLGTRAAGLDRVSGAAGFRALVRLRLIPVVPFNVLNFGSGLTGIGLRDYVAATAIGILPGTAVYTLFADALLAGAAGAREAALLRVAVAGALLVALSFLPALARRLGWLPVVLLLVAAPGPRVAAQAAQPAPPVVDHTPFDRLLARHVTNGLVDYDAFAAAPAFRAYLAQLGRVDPARLPREERLAFWINAYNAFTIDLIVSRRERRSIRNINKSLGLLRLKGPWSEPFIRIAGRTLTLDDIEHGIIRKEFAEPRIHFALVCAAMGCPPLRSEAYTGARLEAQLQDQGVQFIRRSPGKNRVDVATRTVHTSMIFNYYKQDFGGSDAALGRYLAAWYPAGSPERQLLESGRFANRETPYDWTLNSVERARALGITTVIR